MDDPDTFPALPFRLHSPCFRDSAHLFFPLRGTTKTLWHNAFPVRAGDIKRAAVIPQSVDHATDGCYRLIRFAPMFFSELWLT